VALLLRKQGIQRIRPLQGGLDAWREQGYPLANVTLTQISITQTETSIKQP